MANVETSDRNTDSIRGQAPRTLGQVGMPRNAPSAPHSRAGLSLPRVPSAG